MYGSAHFKRTLAARFFGYLGLIIGALTLMLGAEPVVGEEFKYRVNQLLGVRFVVPKVVTSEGEKSPGSGITTLRQAQGKLPRNDNPGSPETTSGFASLLSGAPQAITPVSTDFGLVIERIGANAKVVADVDPANPDDYGRALAVGVAHARGTAYPGQTGNIYLFSHSTDAPWNIVRYNAIFYLLGKLEPGDKVIVFYKGRRYDYVVYDKTITGSEDVQYLTNSYDQSVLTLQTCDPPGTILNRLIIRAKLAGG